MRDLTPKALSRADRNLALVVLVWAACAVAVFA